MSANFDNLVNFLFKSEIDESIKIKLKNVYDVLNTDNVSKPHVPPVGPTNPTTPISAISSQTSTMRITSPKRALSDKDNDSSKYKLLEDFDKEYIKIIELLKDNDDKLSKLTKDQIALQIFNPLHDFVIFVQKMMGDLNYKVREEDPEIDKFVADIESDLINKGYNSKNKSDILKHVEYIGRMIHDLRPKPKP